MAKKPGVISQFMRGLSRIFKTIVSPISKIKGSSKPAGKKEEKKEKSMEEKPGKEQKEEIRERAREYLKEMRGKEGDEKTEKKEIPGEKVKTIKDDKPALLNIGDITLPRREETASEKKTAEPEKKEEKSKLDQIETPEMDKLINIAMIIAIIIGVGVTIGLIYYTGQESYSDLYIYPDSYSNYVEGDTVSFTFGVRSFEIKETKYELKVFLGEEVVKVKEFTLEKGEKLEETINFNIPEKTEFPVKVIITASMNNRENSVHFWLKDRK